MACQAIRTWTFSDLLGAFIDLSIACLLLFASSLTFFVAKFLGLFGLSLPCPCDGLFRNPKSNHCLLRQLMDGPPQKISFVHHSVKNKFPFDSIWDHSQNEHFNSKIVNEQSQKDGQDKLKDRASYNSLSQGRINLTGIDIDASNEQTIEFGKETSTSVKEGKLDLKGKGALSMRPKCGLQRRCKGGYVDYGKFSSVSSYDSLQLDAQDTPRSISIINKMLDEASEDILTFEIDFNHYGENKMRPAKTNIEGNTSYGPKLNNPLNDNNPHEIGVFPFEELGCNVRGDLGTHNYEKSKVIVLEQALEDEHAARVALYLELEKERNAAASAADEAMAMILRLQEEKASIEMEARQYQRMIEEKSAFDAEEMEILKEILMRREREKQYLVKEVEAYREILFGNENSIMRDMASIEAQDASSLNWSVDPTIMHQRISVSIDMSKLQIANSSHDLEIPSIESKKYTLALDEELQLDSTDIDPNYLKKKEMHGSPSTDRHSNPLITNIIHDELFRKHMMLSNENPFSELMEVQGQEQCSKWDQSTLSHQYNMHEIDQTVRNNTSLVVTPLASHVRNDTRIIITRDIDNVEVHGSDQDLESRGPPISISPPEPCVYDIHFIDDDYDNSNQMSIEKDEENKQISSPIILDIPIKCDNLVLNNRLESVHDISRTCLDLNCRLPPTGPSRRKSSQTSLRRHSIPVVDHERLKIDNEVEWLRERLRNVQEGREKLNMSVGHKDREKIQLQLLEDIAGQLREIRQLTEPKKAERQTSLPPLFSKVMSKKRCWRSSSLEVQKSP